MEQLFINIGIKRIITAVVIFAILAMALGAAMR